jgi:hypothetical protein
MMNGVMKNAQVKQRNMNPSTIGRRIGAWTSNVFFIVIGYVLAKWSLVAALSVFAGALILFFALSTINLDDND